MAIGDSKETARQLSTFLEDKYVLICDPSSNFRTSIKQFLLNLKVTNVRTAANTSEARRMLLTTKVGLFIVEWIADSQNGLEFCREIKKRREYKLTPFLLMTAENLRKDVILASEGGVDQYLLKPFSYEDFTQKIGSIMKTEMDPNPINQVLRHADASFLIEDFADAEAYYKQAQKLDPKSARAMEGMARICIQQNQDVKGVVLLQTALSINPNYVSAHKTLLRAYEQMGDTQGMLKETRILHSLSPENPVYALYLANLYLQLKELELSDSFFKKSLALSPALASAYKGMGQVAMLQKNYSKAEKCYKKALDLEKNDLSALNSLGLAYVRMGKYKEGIQKYVIALRLDAKNEKILFNLGQAWEKLGDTEKARQNYKLALGINPEYGKAQRGLKRITPGKAG